LSPVQGRSKVAAVFCRTGVKNNQNYLKIVQNRWKPNRGSRNAKRPDQLFQSYSTHGPQSTSATARLKDIRLIFSDGNTAFIEIMHRSRDFLREFNSIHWKTDLTMQMISRHIFNKFRRLAPSRFIGCLSVL
jgi:hypothetical protein